jgi:hypothetical protein
MSCSAIRRLRGRVMLHGMRQAFIGVMVGAMVGAMTLLTGCDAITGVAAKYNPFISFETRCTRLPASRVDVTAGDVAPRQDFSLSWQSLTRLAEDDPDAHRTFGLTRTSFSEDAHIDIKGLQDTGSHRACSRPQVHVELRMSPMTVYVASELRGDACREAAVLEHEMKHVEVYRQHLQSAAAELGRTLPTLFGQRVFQASDPALSEQEMRGMLEEFLHAFMQDSARQLKQLQDGVDSAAEYDRVGRACGGMPGTG